VGSAAVLAPRAVAILAEASWAPPVAILAEAAVALLASAASSGLVVAPSEAWGLAELARRAGWARRSLVEIP